MSPTTTATKYCHACAQILDSRAEVCPQCGVRQPMMYAGPGATTVSGRNRVAAALFAIFLGAFGVHKFYLGKVGLGVLYLVFFWTAIPAIVGFVEGIIYLTMSDMDFAAKFG
jgi:TM2 domain-containing membrane protein YozV